MHRVGWPFLQMRQSLAVCVNGRGERILHAFIFMEFGRPFIFEVNLDLLFGFLWICIVLDGPESSRIQYALASANFQAI